MALRAWWLSCVRGFGPGRRQPDGWYVRITPNVGFAIPWFGRRRLRFARHHGLQLVEWRGERWMVTKQLLGHSSVRGERFVTGGQANASIRTPSV